MNSCSSLHSFRAKGAAYSASANAADKLQGQPLEVGISEPELLLLFQRLCLQTKPSPIHAIRSETCRPLQYCFSSPRRTWGQMLEQRPGDLPNGSSSSTTEPPFEAAAQGSHRTGTCRRIGAGVVVTPITPKNSRGPRKMATPVGQCKCNSSVTRVSPTRGTREVRIQLWSLPASAYVWPWPKLLVRTFRVPQLTDIRCTSYVIHNPQNVPVGRSVGYGYVWPCECRRRNLY